MARKILCVAEKPAIARAVATHMSGGSFQTVSAPMDKQVHQLITSSSMQSAAINMSRTMNLNLILVTLGETAL